MKHDNLHCKLEKAKEHYIKNVDIRLDDLPGLFGVSISTIYKNAAKQKWCSAKRLIWGNISKEKDLAVRKTLTLDLAGALISQTLLQVDQLYKQYNKLDFEHSLIKEFTLEKVTSLIREGNIQRATII